MNHDVTEPDKVEQVKKPSTGATITRKINIGEKYENVELEVWSSSGSLDDTSREALKQELEEIVEFLRSPQKFSRLGGQIPKGALLVGYDLYGHSGIKSKRPKVPRQKGHIIKKSDRIRKEVKNYRRETSYPVFPESLPTLRVKARLIVEFEDGSEMELLNKRYKFDL